MEDDEVISADSDASYPVLIIPKKTILETNSGLDDDMDSTVVQFINVNITSVDEEGNEMNVYSGVCKVEILDCDVDNQSDTDNIVGEVTLEDYNEDNGREMLIDPTYNTYVNDNYNGMETEKSYSVYSHTEITLRQHSIKSMVSHNEVVAHSALMQVERQKIGQMQMTVNEPNPKSVPHRLTEELECGLFLSQLPEEIIANENRTREEVKYIDSPNDNNVTNQLMSSELQTTPAPQRTILYVDDNPHQGYNNHMNTQELVANEHQPHEEIMCIGSTYNNDAIKQLMSSELQTTSKPQKTILYVGNSSPQGHTVERIAVNDPQIKCVRNGDGNNVVEKSPKKKYQCEKCKQIFYKLATFKQHIDIHQPKVRKTVDCPVEKPLVFVCPECKKSFKTREKFELHRLGHGNPDQECDECHKILASKSTLKNHKKIHLRVHKCPYCRKSYQQPKELHEHLDKIHLVVKCNICKSLTSKLVLSEHLETHRMSEVKTSDSEVAVSNDGLPDGKDYSIYSERKKEHDAIIDQVVNNEFFHLHSKTAKKSKKKICNICLKHFDRLSELKRHLIEHIVRSTLAKCPANNSNGALKIRCDVCKTQTFHRVDRYKAHLRDHAKLTTYKCTFCDKTFSDSSNFSKHKKTHGSQFLQCDSCQRKFHSKKSLAKHVKHHDTNNPLKCCYCDEEFHFQSSLTKHIKSAHTRNLTRYKCGSCSDIFNSLKQKWEHEWVIHNVRKFIVDCLICGSKFRKYCELKAHCKAYHNIEIPLAKLLKQMQGP